MRFTDAAPLVFLAALALMLAGAVAGAAGLSGGGFFWSGVALGAGALFATRDRLKPSRVGPAVVVGFFFLCCLASVGLLDTLLQRHRVRFDLTAARSFTLGPPTLRALEKLNQDVRITVVFRANSPGRHIARDLLGHYQLASQRLQVEFVDPDLKPSLAKKFPGAGHGALVVSSGGRERVVRWPGERDLTLAIVALQAERQLVVAFTRGSGEPGFDDRGPLGSTLASAALEHENYRVGSLDPAVEGDPRAAPALVVVPAGRRDLSPEAVAGLLRMRAAGAALLLLVEPGQPRPNLAARLADWGLNWQGAKVHDLDSHLQGDPGTVVVSRYPPHPVTVGLAETLFPGASALGFASAPEQSPWTPLAITSPGTTSTLPGGAEGPAGTLVLAATREREPGKGRIAVVGDSDFLSNGALARFPVNRDFLLSLVNWLTEQEAMLGEFPERRQSSRLFFTEKHFRALAAVTLLGVPCLLWLVALYWWMEARRP